MANAFEMRRPRHAIGEFSATMRFLQPVRAETFARIRQVAEQQAAKLSLPVPIQQQSVQFSIGPAAQFSVPTPQEGIGFQSFARNGEIETALLCEPDSIVLTLHEYESWNSVHPMIVDTFTPIAEEYLGEVPAVRSFSIQYLNEFRSFSEGQVSTEELFRGGSKWIAPFGVRGNEPWHCHTGLFIPASDRSRFLVNVNCDVSTVSFAPQGTIRTLAKALILVAFNYDVPGRPPLTIAIADARELVSEHMDRAHTLEKQILAEVISNDYLIEMGAFDG